MVLMGPHPNPLPEGEGRGPKAKKNRVPKSGTRRIEVGEKTLRKNKG
jgi:hypothetical protein